jgi:hypothetical protein
VIRKFFREFFDEFKLILRAIPQGIKKVGVDLYNGTPKFFKALLPNMKRIGVRVLDCIKSPLIVTGATTGAKIFKAQVLVKGLVIFTLATTGVGMAVYVVSDMVVENSMATISVAGADNKWSSDGGTTASIALSETPDFANPSVLLKCEGISDLTNISGSSLPSSIDSIDGSHNGEHYVAYTFYLKNTGDVACDINEEMIIKNSIKNVDEAIRVRLYRNGEEVTYAKVASDGMPEIGTTPFVGEMIFSQTNRDVAPGSIIRYTLVIWLEGDDPECLDNLKGGAVSMSMTFSVDRQEGG